MRPTPVRAYPDQRRETGLRQVGMDGARALSRLLVALIENLGIHDRAGARHAPGWPQASSLSAFGPTPLGAEIERAARRAPLPPADWRDSVTGLPIAGIADPACDMPAPLTQAPVAPSPIVPPLERRSEPSSTVSLDEPEAVWQTPFVALPGVRYVRTPDHVLRARRIPDAPVSPLARAEPPADASPTADPDGVQDDAVEDISLSPGPETDAGLDLERMEEVWALNTEDRTAFDMTTGAPLRLRLFNGFPVDLPKAANDPALAPPREEPRRKAAFAVAVRAKAKAPQEAAATGPATFDRVTLAASVTPRASRRAAPTVEWAFPPVELLGEVRKPEGTALTAEMLEQNARLLETTLEDFGIRGEIIHVRAGPVVTLYELEPAPGMKSSRVIGLADDIARSMSALSARVAVVPGRNAIGIELPNERRETVYFREMIESEAFSGSQSKLAIALGKTIGGEPVVAELAKMPHLLVAGTTGSGKSVAINTMILSLLYRLKPEECRLIMVDPKMLELSVYDGIPHLLTPVVTDPKKAVVALKWAVREMEDRYKKMSKLGVRNIDGFNARVAQAKAAGETILMQVTTGFDRETGRPTTEERALDLVQLPYIVVIVDEMADLMMVAGKDIEGAIQRLAQMARAAGIHLIMATQRPSVDVITGTIKANFPTRISFQVTSKIDSRTILGEMGAEQLLGQGDMLHMQGGGRIYRVHGPFVSDEEVERVVAHLKRQRAPDYLDSVTDELEADETAPAAEDEQDGAVFDKTAIAGVEEDGDLYEQAVKIVLRDKKSSVSYVQRRLSVGYNKAASLIERMEKEGVLGPASHTGKREILAHGRGRIISGVPAMEGDD